MECRQRLEGVERLLIGDIERAVPGGQQTGVVELQPGDQRHAIAARLRQGGERLGEADRAAGLQGLGDLDQGVGARRAAAQRLALLVFGQHRRRDRLQPADEIERIDLGVAVDRDDAAGVGGLLEKIVGRPAKLAGSR